MPVFRSQVQGAMLAEVLLRPTQEFSLTDLADRAGAALSTVYDEANRLVTAGIFTERRVGRSRLVRASSSNPAVRPLTDLVAFTFGPFSVVGDAFRDVANVERVLLYGSWAERYLGTSGPPPRDVDVLVIGHPKRAEVYAAADAAESRLGRAVNPVVVSAQRFEANADALIRDIRASPVVEVLG
jgi:hypothetical protein